MQLDENNDVLKAENELLLFEYDYKDESIHKNENIGAEIQKALLVRFTNENLSLDEIEEEFCFDNVKVDISEANNEEEHMDDVINDELRSASMGSLDDIQASRDEFQMESLKDKLSNMDATSNDTEIFDIDSLDWDLDLSSSISSKDNEISQ